MEKKYLLILLLVIILLIGIIVFYSLQNKKVSLEAPAGIVKLNDPEMNKNFEDINGTLYYDKNPDYFFRYDKKTHIFSIVINSMDIQTTREAAEKEFIKVLDISKEDACKLTVDLRAIQKVIDFNSLQNISYGLSFCPNGIAFPK